MPTENRNRETLVTLIERQHLINDRYSKVKRFGENAGRGSFSIMFTAFDNVSRQKVALKFLNPSWAGDQYRVECFTREAKMLQIFKEQPNILQIIDGKENLAINITTSEGSPLQLSFQFIATELAQGSLRDCIYSSTTSAVQNLLFFREVCKAVQRIHANQVCHRDLKPENFLIFPQKKLKLSDFGTARLYNRNAEALLQRYMGPPGDITYTSPELLCGLYFEKRFAFCNDFYSMGAILFEVFTKTYLNLTIFNNIYELWDIIRCFSAIPERSRKEIYDDFIKGIARSRPLPDIFLYNQEVPHCIKHRLNILYKSLANLDYRERLINFKTIFRQIDICRIILENEEKYKKWIELKRRFRKKRQKIMT